MWDDVIAALKVGQGLRYPGVFYLHTAVHTNGKMSFTKWIKVMDQIIKVRDRSSIDSVLDVGLWDSSRQTPC